MDLCDDGHEEVCYEGRGCPMCDKQEEVERLQTEIESLRDQLQEERNG
jgi:HAMP domain-containing protein